MAPDGRASYPDYTMDMKERAAVAAMAHIKSGMIVGLGTGSTSKFFHIELGKAVRSGQLKDIIGVPTSIWAAEFAAEQGVTVASLAKYPNPDVAVDGADEIDPQMNMIKGLGGALLREKMVAAPAKKMVVIADSRKIVNKLGTTQPLPVEVTPWEYESHVPFFRSLGGEPTLRQNKEKGGTYITDNKNYIYDVRFAGGIPDAVELEKKLKSHPGIVETGLFIGIAAVALIAGENGVEERVRK
jgi:ribose 5-phosphate isomerase A